MAAIERGDYKLKAYTGIMTLAFTFCTISHEKLFLTTRIGY